MIHLEKILFLFPIMTKVLLNNIYKTRATMITSQGKVEQVSMKIKDGHSNLLYTLNCWRQ